jgi:hypothetical protein
MQVNGLAFISRHIFPILLIKVHQVRNHRTTLKNILSSITYPNYQERSLFLLLLLVIDSIFKMRSSIFLIFSFGAFLAMASPTVRPHSGKSYFMNMLL